ncbi:MFS transporter [Halomonas sp. RA08-2]|uniref:MFS transporter n=1 Tax=Halomonas sp. RA08-2 TaxID=3440842 RepID=UPI003EECE1BE
MLTARPSLQVRLTTVLGVTQTLAWASSYYLPAILATPIASDIGIERHWVFAAFSLSLLITAACGPWVGQRIDRFGGRTMLSLSSLVLAAGLGLLAIAQGPIGLVLSWVIIGVGMAMGLYDAAFATLTRAFGRDARRAITGVTLMAGFASTLGWPLTAWLNSALGWREACLFWVAIHLLVCLPLHRFLPGEKEDKPVSTDSPTDVQGDEADGVRRWTMAGLAYVFAAGWFVSTAMAAHLPALLQETGVSLATAVAAGALVGPAQVGARFAEFTLMRRAHPLVAARVATCLHPVGAALMVAFGMPAAGFAILHGAGNGLLTIAAGTLPLSLFGAQGYGLRQGWIIAPARVAQAFSPWLFGVMLTAWGAGALWLTSCLLLVALAVLLLIRARPAS